MGVSGMRTSSASGTAAARRTSSFITRPSFRMEPMSTPSSAAIFARHGTCLDSGASRGGRGVHILSDNTARRPRTGDKREVDPRLTGSFAGKRRRADFAGRSAANLGRSGGFLLLRRRRRYRRSRRCVGNGFAGSADVGENLADRNVLSFRNQEPSTKRLRPAIPPSNVSLSVATTIRISPFRTGSPSFFFHWGDDPCVHCQPELGHCYG